MLIHVLFEYDPGDYDLTPWAVDACDEYTVGELNGFPDEYKAKRAKANVREISLEVPDKTIRALFETPVVKCKP